MKKIKLLLGALALMSSAAYAGIAVDSGPTTKAQTGIAGGTLSIPFTTGSDPNSIMIVAVQSLATATGYSPVNDITFNGSLMTEKMQTQVTSTYYDDLEIWYLQGAARSTGGTVGIDFGGSAATSYGIAGVIEYSGVDPFTPFGNSAQQTETSAGSLTTAFAPMYTGSWFLTNSGMGATVSGSITQDATLTARWNVASALAGVIGAFGDKAGGSYSATNVYAGTTFQVGAQQALELVPVQSTATATPTNSPSPTQTSTASFSASPTYTSTTIASPTPTFSASPTASPTKTFSASPTTTNSPTKTASPTSTFTSSASPTASPTSSASPTASPTATNSPVETATPRDTLTFTNTPTASPTSTSTFTASPTSTAIATATPVAISGVWVGQYQQNESAVLYWNNNSAVNQWFIYCNGRLKYSPYSSQVGTSGTSQTQFLMGAIAPSSIPVVITMTASIGGVPISGSSSPVTLTSNVPVGGGTVIYNEATNPVYITGTVFTSGTGSSLTWVSNTASAAVQIAGSITNTVQVSNQQLTYADLSLTTGVPANFSSGCGVAVSCTAANHPCGVLFCVGDSSLTNWRYGFAALGSLPTIALGTCLPGFNYWIPTTTATGMAGLYFFPESATTVSPTAHVGF